MCEQGFSTVLIVLSDRRSRRRLPPLPVAAAADTLWSSFRITDVIRILQQLFVTVTRPLDSVSHPSSSYTPVQCRLFTPVCVVQDHVYGYLLVSTINGQTRMARCFLSHQL